MIEIQYLESTENLRKNIQRTHGWTPNAGQAEGIAACLRQGRLFYEAAKRAPLEIRPLELYYGTAAYAKALILSSDRGRNINTLQQSHGIKDRSAHNARLSGLAIEVNQRGTFQEFNDCVRTLNVFRPLSMDGSNVHFRFDCAASGDMVGMNLSLKEIFGRLPGLESLYRATFDEREEFDVVSVVGPDEGFTWTVQIAPPPWGRDIGNLIALLTECRRRMPFLQRWTFHQASYVAGTSVQFLNAPPLEDELNPEAIRIEQWGFHANPPPFSRYFRDIEVALGHLVGDTVGGYYPQPINGLHFAPQSLQFLALHLLSSLVRYRPATWMHALSRSSSNGRAADDAMLALIEAFMESVQSNMPKFVAGILRSGLSN
jgi:hypothetical protein